MATAGIQLKLIFLILIPSLAFSASQKYQYRSPRGLNDEMQNIYSNIPNKQTTPGIYLSAGAPTFTPAKVGDIDVSTTTGKVYISTSVSSSGSWAIVN